MIFNPTTLAAAKDAGIPIAVIVGILGIFAAIAADRSYVGERRYAVISSFGALSVICLIFIFWVATREVYQWVDTKALADWGGSDEGWTNGRSPLSEHCSRDREGVIAVCWSNRPGGYPMNPPPIFRGTPGTGAWCTYKLRENLIFGRADGESKGRVFVCVRVSI